MRNWVLKEQFDHQDTHYNAVVAKYEAAVVSAGTHLKDLLAEKGALIRDEFTGKDRSKEKAKIAARIESAEKALAAAEHECRQVHDYRRSALDGRISVRDLVNDWSGDYRSAVRSEELQPILERLAASREAYLNALLDLKQLEAEYEPAYRQLSDVAYKDNQANHPGNYVMPKSIISNSDVLRISHDDLMMIDRGQLPNGVKRIPGGI
ncbi:hypothetical protein [Paenibacillus sp. MMO-177]|uniref:hypothetical protein n=1 Tax=Paenibacillus sp. MMO-177 TaxID=3081289 RepID=UPI00301A4095